ncbi:DNA-binding protein [Nitrospirillum bahiense]|uniref:AlpA family transcriptional regulator n=1 Tax=Nitrospirillum amazonense TaxID=28077 RepID=A0A560FC70_9PROT|nr:DNA-binding protein [Nitrospirillum amazonense]TWB19212.1 hypothetical protein FBZ88_12267 [Nitrospirillum amazonense]
MIMSMSQPGETPRLETPEVCLPPALRKPRLRRWEAADYLGLVHGLAIKPATLAKLASVGGGPSYQLVGRSPLYPTSQLDAWATARLGKLVASTSEYDTPKAGT